MRSLETGRRLFAAICALLAVGAAAEATTFIVNEAQDLASGASCASGSPTCTLREAILQANLDVSSDVIVLPAGHYRLGIAGRDEDDAASGDLDIDQDLQLIGASSETVIIDGNGIDRVFDIHSAEVEISGVTITGGDAGVGETGTAGGGAIRLVSSDLTIQASKIVGNRAPAGGGLRAAFSYLSMTDVYVGSNTLFVGSGLASGGGISAVALYDLTLDRTSISENRCETPSSCSADGVRLADCEAADAVDILNSTLARNQGSGARFTDCDVTITHSTLAENMDYGLHFTSNSGSNTVGLASSIVAHNSDQDCRFTSGLADIQGNQNLDTDDSCGLDGPSGDLPLTDPLLHPFDLYGGLKPSYHPMPGSPVIDVVGSCRAIQDQDNLQRPDGDQTSMGDCDVGSIEVLPCDNPKPALYIGPGPIGSGTWEACHTLQAAGTVILDGSTVDFWARELIRMDEGFTVGAGVTLTVGLKRTADWTP